MLLALLYFFGQFSRHGVDFWLECKIAIISLLQLTLIIIFELSKSLVFSLHGVLLLQAHWKFGLVVAALRPHRSTGLHHP